VAWGAAWIVVTFSLYLIAAASDESALQAITNPGWYCWLTLCALSGFGLLLTFLASRTGASVPFYFRIALMAGATCGVFTFSTAWQAITANKAHATPSPQGAHLDLRGQTVRDASYAERNLRDSDFSEATLDRVDLSGADLSESDLRQASLRKVDLSEADLCGVDLRGADLRGAIGLRAVKDWSYVFYNDRTRLPHAADQLLSTHAGPIPDNGHDLLYMCKSNVVRRLHG
jgi:hypothetical protein